MCLPSVPWQGGFLPDCVCLGGATAESQGCFGMYNWSKVGGLISRDTDGHFYLWDLGLTGPGAKNRVISQSSVVHMGISPTESLARIVCILRLRETGTQIPGPF